VDRLEPALLAAGQVLGHSVATSLRPVPCTLSSVHLASRYTRLPPAVLLTLSLAAGQAKERHLRAEGLRAFVAGEVHPQPVPRTALRGEEYGL
jgi:hypothetical protein